MKHILAIIKKELRVYFNSPIAYIFITVFLVLSSWLFFRTFFLINNADMRQFFSLMPWIFLFFIPSVTMRLWAEEKRQGTIEILLTLPVRDYEAVMGKFFASLIFIGCALFATFPIPLIVIILGDADVGVIIAGYIGTFLLAASFIAIGLTISAYTKNQIIAWILTVSFSFFLLVLGYSLILDVAPSFLVPVFEFLGLGKHYDSISRGVLDSRDLLYYISMIAFFLYLNVVRLGTRR